MLSLSVRGEEFHLMIKVLCGSCNEVCVLTQGDVINSIHSGGSMRRP